MEIVENLKLVINRSAYYIHNYELRQCDTLERSLSVYDFIDRKYTHRGYVYDEKERILKIPIGVDLNFILNKCSSDGVIITNIENNSDKFIKSRRVNSIKCTAEPRNSIQTKTVEFIVAKDAADKSRKQRLVSLDTGFGKTVCAIMAVSKLKMPAVVISVNLSKQWLDRILTFTTGKINKDIIFLENWGDIDKLLKMKDAPMAAFYILGLDAAIAGLRDDPNKLDMFYKKFGIGMQIFDEAHLHFLKIINVLVNTNVERNIFLSATPARSEKGQDALYKRIFTLNTPSYGENTHSINKYNIISVRYKTSPSYIDLIKIEPRRGVHAIAYFKYMFKYPSRYYILFDIINYFSNRIFKIHDYDKDKKVIVYVQSLSGIKILKKMLENRSNNSEFKPTIGDYSGNTNKKDRHLELENNIILTTFANNAGLDVNGLIMIINMIPMSSDILLKQIRGRLRDKKGYYVDVYDEGFEGMVRQKDKRMINHKRNARSIVYYEHDGKKINKCFS